MVSQEFVDTNLYTKNDIAGASQYQVSRSFAGIENPLGNIAINASAPAKVTTGHKSKKRVYRQFSKAKSLLRRANIKSKRGNRHRTRTCMDARTYGAESITLRLGGDFENSSASIGNVQTCGSVWACPVCAPRIAVQRGGEIQQALSWSKDEGLLPVLISLTAQHNQGNRLADLRDKFKLAWRSFSSGRVWRSIKSDYQIKHWIANREAPHGGNGWHYHMHMALFIPRSVLAKSDIYEDLEADLREFWLKCLSKAGLEGIGDYALKVSTHGSVGKRYLSKLGLEVGKNQSDLRYEMSGAANKTGGGVSSWKLLEKASRGDEKTADLWLEFVQAMDGEKWITWSRGFKDLVGLNEVSDDDAAADDEGDGENLEDWMHISDEDYRPVRIFQAQSDLIDIAAYTRSEAAVVAYLGYLDALLAAQRGHDFSSLTRDQVRDRLNRWRGQLAFSQMCVQDAALREQYIDDFTASIHEATKHLERLKE